MDADYSSYLKFIATYAPTIFGYIITVLAMVLYLNKMLKLQHPLIYICDKVHL